MLENPLGEQKVLLCFCFAVCSVPSFKFGTFRESFSRVNILVRQETVLGPILNNCSSDNVCKEGASYRNGLVGIKPLEFGDVIADPNNGLYLLKRSNDITVAIVHHKKYPLLLTNAKFYKLEHQDTLITE